MNKILIILLAVFATTQISLAQVEHSTGGSASVYTLTYPANIPALTAGLSFTFKANHSSIGASTININSIGAVPIKKEVSQDLEANDILAGQIVTVVYDGANFQMISKAGTSGGGSTSSRIEDTDNNTSIETDDLGSGSEDIIHYNLGGIEHFRMDGPRMEVLNSGSSVFIGEGAGETDNLANNENVFLGYNSGNSNLDGTSNVGVGSESLESQTSGINNTALGRGAMKSNTTGSHNTALGSDVLYLITTGDANVGAGYQALAYNSTGNSNVAIGRSAFKNNVAGSFATAIGTNAMENANNNATTYTNENVAVGYSALRGSGTIASNTGNRNTALGYQSLRGNSTGSDNIGIGRSALYTNSTGGNNVAIGNDALYENTTFSDNVAIGKEALKENVANRNTAIGSQVMPANTTGTQNVAVGWRALWSNVDANSNTAVGYGALLSTNGQNNTGLGLSAGQTNTTGINNTFIGHYADANSGNLSNATAIGSSAYVTQSNSLVLGSISGVNGAGSNTKVGIGTTAPSNKLEVVGDAAKFDSVIIVNGANDGYVLTSDAAGHASWKPGADDGDWTINGIDVYNTSAGKVGVGVGSPTSMLGKFTVKGVETGTNGIEGVFLDVINNSGNSVNTIAGIRFGLYNASTTNQSIPGGILYESDGSTGGRGDMHFVNNSSNGLAYLNFSRMTIKNNGRIGVGTTTPATIFDIDGTDALVLPVGTTAQRPAVPEAGMLRFNSNLTSFEGYDGTAWSDLAAGGGSGWGLSGNAGTSGSDFIGTTDAQDFRIRTNNNDVITVKSNGNVGIGVTNPINELEVAGAAIFKYGGGGVSRPAVAHVAITHIASRNYIESANGSAPEDITFQAQSYNFTTGTSTVGEHGTNLYIEEGGNIGIGTIIPQATLDVVGTLRYSDGNESNGNILVSDPDGKAEWKMNAVSFDAAVSTSSPLNWSTSLGNPADKVIFNTENFDEGIPGGSFTSSVFTAPESGIYSFDVTLLIDFSGGGDLAAMVGLMKNTDSTPVKKVRVIGRDNVSSSVSLSCIVRLAQNDQIEVRAISTDSGDTLSISMDEEGSWFSGHLIYAD